MRSSRLIPLQSVAQYPTIYFCSSDAHIAELVRYHFVKRFALLPIYLAKNIRLTLAAPRISQ